MFTPITMMKNRHRLVFILLSAMGLSACCRQYATLSMPDALHYMEMGDSMYRGLDYLGTSDGYHYFAKRRELAADVRFRVPESEYFPVQVFPYRSCFTQRVDVSAEWSDMVMHIIPQGKQFNYAVGGKNYNNAAAVPQHLWKSVREVLLPYKIESLNAPAVASISLYLENNQHVLLKTPISGLPEFMLPHVAERAGNGAPHGSAIDALINNSQQNLSP